MVADTSSNPNRLTAKEFEGEVRISTAEGAGLLFSEPYRMDTDAPRTCFCSRPAKAMANDWFRPDGFPIAVERRDPRQPFGPLTPEFSEIVLVTGGSATHVTEDESQPISAGDIFVICGDRAHGYRETDDLQLINILFVHEHPQIDLWDLPGLPGYQALFAAESVGHGRKKSLSRLRLLPEEFSVAVGYAAAMEDELRDRHPGHASATAAFFTQLVGYLSRRYDAARGADTRALHRVSKAIRYLEAHYDQDVSLEALAELTHMSSRSFLRAFQAATGVAPVTYLLKLRLNRAAAFLRADEENVTSAAYKAGFNDSNHFARQFRKHYGLSPSAYRKQGFCS